MREWIEDILADIGPILMAIFAGILFLSVFYVLHWVDVKDRRAFEAVPVVLETKMGVETECQLLPTKVGSMQAQAYQFPF